MSVSTSGQDRRAVSSDRAMNMTQRDAATQLPKSVEVI